jgi:outer membrane immunogenic protein
MYERPSGELIMKRFWLAGFASTALIATPAMAADLAVKAPLPPAPVASWAGFYVGLNAGYVSTRNTVDTATTPMPDFPLGVVPGVTEGLAALAAGSISLGNRGSFIGGAQIGYNWQFGGFLAGIETDIQGLAQSSTDLQVTTTAVVVGVPITSNQTANMRTRYLGTVRGRVGFLATPALLIYGTGGLAYGGVEGRFSLLQTGTNGFVGVGGGNLSTAHAGWTGGAGLEWMFAPNATARFEYLHYDLGTPTFDGAATGMPKSTFFASAVYLTTSSSAHVSGDLVRLGVNYKFGGPLYAAY